MKWRHTISMSARAYVRFRRTAEKLRQPMAALLERLADKLGDVEGVPNVTQEDAIAELEADAIVRERGHR